VRAFKFLDPNGTTVFTGARWVLPTAVEPGPWVHATAVRPCHSGIHACRADDLAYWIGAELWEIELDGEIHESHHKVVASHGRLLRRVDRWADDVAAELPHWCAWRTRDRATEVLTAAGLDEWASRFSGAETLRDVRHVATDANGALGESSVGGGAAALAGDAARLTGWLAIGAFIAACAAGHAVRRDSGDESAYAAGFDDERRQQSAWIAQRLQLA
jgi:hypothetical protein